MQNNILNEWIRKAEGDFLTATRESKVRNRVNYDAVCYHSQQCIEKYLKVFRVFHGLNYKRTHALIPLLEDCIIIDPTFEFIRQQCDDITGIDQFRYPSDFANKDDAKLALKSAKIIRKFIRGKLGL
ncbi:MAG: HEPN domain-containing protein [Bacteroidetes bacterium]|nr:HEPN domain-containing protein [Bacteroidota bacterium]MBU1421903.1 HEPN domain-containing protein [Bacteroidota bacterium]MBU2472153.1 HEPN domain-containing protein [Bacteroidota bacterium]MBU2635992.1 HEPN domain-containing protein [Bacteroidota bacterium]